MRLFMLSKRERRCHSLVPTCLVVEAQWYNRCGCWSRGHGIRECAIGSATRRVRRVLSTRGPKNIHTEFNGKCAHTSHRAAPTNRLYKHRLIKPAVCVTKCWFVQWTDPNIAKRVQACGAGSCNCTADRDSEPKLPNRIRRNDAVAINIAIATQHKSTEHVQHCRSHEVDTTYK